MRLGAIIAVLANFGLAGPLHADARADSILRQAFEKLHAAKSFSADLSATIRIPGAGVSALKGRILALKPNYLRVDLQGRTPMRYVCDGKFYYRQVSHTEYVRERADPRPSVFVGVWEGEIDAFFGGAGLTNGLSTSYRGTETVAGMPCDVVSAEMKNPARAVTYAITRKDRLIVRAAIRLGNPPNVQEQINRLQNHRLDAVAAPKDFQFKPDPGMRQRPLRNVVQRGRQLSASLAKNGFGPPAACAPISRRGDFRFVPPGSSWPPARGTRTAGSEAIHCADCESGSGPHAAIGGNMETGVDGARLFGRLT